ncbi:penicillin-binding protein 2 [Mucilaginibacter sp. UYCu711]
MIIAIFICVTCILLARLFYLQMVDNRYVVYANKNVIRSVINYPARGVILDRNHKLLVDNQPVYDILIVPKQVKAFDTLSFGRFLGISASEVRKRIVKASSYSPFIASTFAKQISAVQYARLQEVLGDFTGFYAQQHYIRTYPDSTAAQFVGFIGEVNEKDIDKSHGYYKPGDYIGRSGVEKAYEGVLKGRRGIQKLLVDSRNAPKGHLANGAFDTIALAGDPLVSSLDIRLQKLGEQLMHNKVGSIVAIEPETGEVLCFVSSPTYDPNLMVGEGRGKRVSEITKNPYDPFFIRPIQAYYPPGSSFKPLNALIALQEGLITPQTTFFCPPFYQAGNHRVKDEHFNGITNLEKGIKMSSNTFFCIVFNKLMNLNGVSRISGTYQDWKERINRFGFGKKTGIDLPNEKKGFVPDPAYYDHIFGKNKWRANTIISLAIGQGELLATPLQMANAECTIANRGFYYKPHLVKAIGAKNTKTDTFKVKNYVGIDQQYFEPVIEGMQEVVESGTATASRIPGIVMCGKTSTVQNPHGKNHSIFVAFAPREHPRIAITVVVENGGYGSEWAAPIASFIVEKYLRDNITVRPSGRSLDYYIKKNLLPRKPTAKLP